MRTARRILAAIPIFLIVAFSLSCNNDYGVFSSIQQEKKQSGNTIFQKTSVNNVFKLGSNYFAATRRLMTRNVAAGSSWSEVTIGGSSNYDLRSVVLATSTIYALVELNSALSIYSSADGYSTALAAVTPPALTGTFSLGALFAANGELYVEGHIYDSSTLLSSYKLYHYNGSVFAAVLGLASDFIPAANKTIRGVVYDSVTKYWFAAEDKLFKGSAADGSDATSAIAGYTPDLAGKSIWGISYATGIAIPGSNTIYITTTDGYLYKGGTATGSLVVSLPLTQVIQVPTNPSGDNILVGTDAIGYSAAVGYYEGTFGSMGSGSAGKVTSSNGIYTSTVSTFPVHAFFYDSTAQKVFICVSPGTVSLTNYGLYSSDWDGANWSGWSAE